MSSHQKGTSTPSALTSSPKSEKWASDELEPAVQRLVKTALSRDFLPAGAFTVETLTTGPTMTVFVYLSDTLLATAQVNLTS